MKKVLIAYSGGVDSTFLCAAAARALGRNNIHAITAVSATYPAEELRRAKRIAKRLRIRHTLLPTDELSNKTFCANPVNRCFHCKDELFGKLSALAKKEGAVLCDANNYSDRGDFRPGRKAAKKWGVRSPLEAAKMTKDDIRALSRELRLPTWNLPAQACLASRFPYGTPLTPAALKKVEQGENILRKAGFTQFRLRHHGEIARIELEKREMARVLNRAVEKKITAGLKKLGWRFITIDLQGYRCGSLNA